MTFKIVSFDSRPEKVFARPQKLSVADFEEVEIPSASRRAKSLFPTSLFSLQVKWKHCRTGPNQRLASAIPVSPQVATEKDKSLIRFFKQLPADRQEELFLFGSEAEQAEAIRMWQTNVTQLDLSNNRLSLIPEEIEQFANLRSLDVCRNSIRDLSPVLKLAKLTRLLFSDNLVEKVPSFRSLPLLTDISFHSNLIRPTEEMLELFPETPRVRRSALLSFAVQKRLAGESVSIPASWRQTQYSSLPSDLIQTIAQYARASARGISRMWNQKMYPVLFDRYKSSSILKRWIDPVLQKEEPRKRVLAVQNQVIELIKDSELELPPVLDAASLEQAVKDRSLILYFRQYGPSIYGIKPDSFLNGSATQQAAQIRTLGSKWKADLILSDVKLITLPEEIKFSKAESVLFIGNEIENVAEISLLPNVKNLTFKENLIKDIEPLRPLKRLEDLCLAGNRIEEIRPLESLERLQTLNLEHNQISNIEPLRPLESLKALKLGSNQIKDISSLQSLRRLRILDLSNNLVQDLEPLRGLWLIELELSNNQIKVIEPLGSLVHLTQLFIRNNQVEDIEPLRTLVRLTDLSFSDNQVRDIQPLRSLVALRSVALHNNRIPANVDISQFPDEIRSQITPEDLERQTPS